MIEGTDMKKLLPLILILGFISPVQPAQALGCAKPQNVVKNGKWSFNDAKEVNSLLELYIIVLTNPKCFSAKDITDFKKSVKDFVKQCNDPKEQKMSEAVFGKNTWNQFCKGMKDLVKYTK